MICAGMTTAVPGGLGSSPFSDILSFIPDTIKAAGGIASSIPGVLAATGNKDAQAYAQQQASLQCSAAGGDWTGTACDMGDVAVRREATALVKAYAPWVGLGVGAVGLTIATIYAFKGRR